MRASFLRKIWIMAVCTKIIFVASIRGLWYGFRGEQNKINTMLHKKCLVILKIVRARISIIGKENLNLQPGKQYIVMSTHSSHFDIFALFITFAGAIRMIAKKELFSIPLLGRAMLAAKTIPLDRNNPKQVIKDLAYAKKIMKEGFLIWISPEGSRVTNHVNRKLKKGGFVTAIQTNAKIIPVYISGTEKILPSNTWDFNLDQNISVRIMPEIDTSKYSMKTLPDLMDELSKSWKQASVETTSN
jgi:1-acyl-sn-glycerol-3-phosphate acyltransferase